MPAFLRAGWRKTPAIKFCCRWPVARSPVEQPVPMRSGGFGGAAGLADFIRTEGFDILVDATHPYAARISANAVEAARLADIPLVVLSRPVWPRQPGDTWQSVHTVGQAVTTLGTTGRRVFLALGRQELLPFEAAPQHSYLIRSVDPVEPPLTAPNARYITARGPFLTEDEIRMLEENRIEVVISKTRAAAPVTARSKRRDGSACRSS